ncbi:hypothetical protein [Paenibacillus sp. 453mf]|uniref:hypothetical protein n=1 Tax=Paenibacillus sp. 453mf TaxID=1761874 RepID=UPI0008E501B3|nr:hypothetical protein [Paenibacillus sp. 453mf]SFS96525.1 hypothetical protein SAMN04488601_1113 [Paenibacillus sp. 453mf]
MKKVAKIGLTMSLLMGIIGGTASASELTNEQKVIETVNKAYTAAQNLDATTFAELTTDIKWGSEEEQLKVVTSSYEILKNSIANESAENADLLISFNVGNVTEVNENEYSVELSLTFSNSGKLPTYNVPVKVINGEWTVVLENIILLDKDNPEAREILEQTSTSFERTSPLELLGDNSQVEVYKNNKPSFNHSDVSVPTSRAAISYYASTLEGLEAKNSSNIFTRTYSSNAISIKGWQEPDHNTKQAHMMYSIWKHGVVGEINPQSKISYWGTKKQSIPEQWFYHTFTSSEVPTGIPLYLNMKNLISQGTTVAGNLYN